MHLFNNILYTQDDSETAGAGEGEEDEAVDVEGDEASSNSTDDSTSSSGTSPPLIREVIILPFSTGTHSC